MSVMSISTGLDRPHPDAIHIRSLSVEANLDCLEPLWREFQTYAIGHVFQTYDWMKAWSDHVGSARQIEPRVVVGMSEDGRPAFLLPFGLRRARGARVLEWLGAEHADYHAGLFDPKFLALSSQQPGLFASLFDRIVQEIGPFDLVHFARQPDEIAGYPNPFLNLPNFSNASSAHATRLGDDWDSYYASKRGKGWRRTDRGKLKRLSEIGEVSFVIAEEDGRRRDVVEALFRQKRQKLSEMGIPDMFAPPGVQDFYHDLAARSWPRGPAQVSALYCGDRIAAANLGLIFGNRYYYVLHSYDLTELQSCSPGRELMYRLMQWSISQGLSTYDFTIGDESYKENWCEESTPLYDAAVPYSFVGRMLAASCKLEGTVKRRIKTDKRLWRAAQAVRSGIGTLRKQAG